MRHHTIQQHERELHTLWRARLMASRPWAAESTNVGFICQFSNTSERILLLVRLSSTAKRHRAVTPRLLFLTYARLLDAQNAR